MKEPLSEMSLEELWQLFPIILKKHDPEYANWYAEEKDDILRRLGNKITRISHIGSTSVPGLLAKPTVDILLEIYKTFSLEEIKTELIDAGWLLMHTQNEPFVELVFNKGYTPDGFAKKVYHLHVRYSGDWDELYFRDYLLIHKEIASEYAELKAGLLKKYEHDRDGYTEAKTEFVKKHTAAARGEFGNRYKPQIKES